MSHNQINYTKARCASCASDNMNFREMTSIEGFSSSHATEIFSCEPAQDIMRLIQPYGHIQSLYDKFHKRPEGP